MTAGGDHSAGLAGFANSIAIVAGPLGPVASADFQVSAPGASLTALDSYVERLAAELADSRR